MTSVAQAEQWQEQKAKVDRFVARFDNESYRLLAYHAALPLVLTPELVNYLRNEFLRREEVPWEAEVDLLLSDLCSQVSYELYAMDTQVRAYLLEEIKDSPFWQQRMREVAQVLISYVNFLSRVNPEQRQPELEAQRLAAMVYMGDETCQKAAQEIAERLRQVSDSADSGKGSKRGIRAELARLARITQELAPQLQQTPALVEYARLVQQVLRNPKAADPEALRQVYQVGDVSLTVSPHVFSTDRDLVGGEIELADFPALQVLDFEIGQLIEQGSVFPPLQAQTVETVTLFFEPDTTSSETPVSPVLLALLTFPFEIATMERNSTVEGQWTINRQPGEAQLHPEKLGETLRLEIVAIPAGNFMMGSPTSEPERLSREEPQHKVQINDFYMGRYPVTQAQWRFVAELPQVDRKLNPEPSHFRTDERPVERISWFDAVEFCARLSQYTELEYRLPTEAEWEYACRAGTTTPFHFGATITPDLANYNETLAYDGTSSYDGASTYGEYRRQTTPVDHYGIANAFGLSDMHGNVWEWCQDHWHETYKGAPIDGIAWVSKNDKAKRILRGGSWINHPRSCRSAYRINIASAFTNNYVGFRVVCSAPRTIASYR